MNARTLAPLMLLTAACQSPGTGGRGGRIPVDAIGSDSGGSDSSVTDTGGTTTTEDPTDTTIGDDTTTPFDTGGNDTVSTTCTEAPTSGELAGFTSIGGGAWASPQGLNLGLGGSASDSLVVTFESNATGQFNLAGSTPDTCTRCVQLAVDIGNGGKSYFANSGSIQVLSSPGSALDVVLTDVRLSEVNSEGTIVSGGACIHVGLVELLGEGETCTGSCAGKVCGDDGCGATCGSCGGTTTCNAAGTACVGGGTPTCKTLALTGPLVGVQPGFFGLDLTSLSLGGSGDDLLQLEFWTTDTGSFNLASTVNSNYATCEQCIRIFEDDDGAGNAATVFYQSKGTLAVASGSILDGDPPTVSATFTNVQLVEVEFDASLNSTPVDGGRCYTISNRTLSTQ